MFAGLKKCRPMTSSGRFVAAAICVHVLVGRVGCEDRARLTAVIQACENRFLELGVLEYRFDNEVHFGKRTSYLSSLMSARHFGALSSLSLPRLTLAA